jgi:WD40 repeat protein
VWVYNPQRDVMTRLTFGGGLYQYPRWSPDGRFVVFESASSLHYGIFQARADGASQPQALTQSKAQQLPWSFTPDGKRLAYVDAGVPLQIWTVPLEDQGGQLKAGTPEPFLKSRFNDVTPAFSPDGRWLAYRSDASGKNEIYVRAFPPRSASSSGSAGPGGQWQISNSDGVQPIWSPIWSRNGHELLYLSGDQIMAASYAVKGETFVAAKPRVWIAKAGLTSTYLNAMAAGGSVPGMWDLAPDGKRAAVVTPVESAGAPKQEHEVVFLENFIDELRRRVPLGK